MADLDWSLRPLVAFSRWSGLDLSWNHPRRCPSAVWPVVSFALAGFVSVYQVAYFFSNPDAIHSAFGDNEAKTSLFMDMWAYSRAAAHWLVIHSSLVALSRCQWPELMRSLESVELRLDINEEDRRFTKSVSLVAIVSMTTSVSWRCVTFGTRFP